ncbi:hypothetical protein LGZ98_20870 [Photorhabdus kayaii]|nr:hypothetical protein [Photorhabdus kayaii]
MAVSSGCGSSGEGITKAKHEKNSQMRMIIKVGKKPKKSGRHGKVLNKYPLIFFWTNENDYQSG